MSLEEAIGSAVKPFHLLRLRLGLRPERVLHLPPQQGSSLRGALAASVKDLVCVRRELQECRLCPMSASCAYPYLFETSAPPGEGGTRGYEQFPRPYVISYPAPVREERRTPAEAGPTPDGAGSQREYELGLTLVGRSIQFFPYVALALRDLENRGIGRGRGRFELAWVEALDLEGLRRTLYDGGSGLMRSHGDPLRGADVLRQAAQALPAAAGGGDLAVRFLSPTALHHQGRVAALPEFHVLVRNLLRRLSMLALGHCDYRMELDFPEAIRQSEKVGLVRVEACRVDWERVSARQRKRVPMRGFWGEAVYAGDVGPFLPLLLLGSLTHVGDNCAFGMGRFIVGLPPGRGSHGRGPSWLPAGWEFAGEKELLWTGW